jgi:hypothetical protein
MTELRALDPVHAGRKTVQPGESFRCPERIARQYVQQGVAERVGNDGDIHTAPHPSTVGPSVTKPDGPSMEKRSWEANGSWKTLCVGGDEVGKVQCTKAEAEAWASGDVSLNEIQ